MRHHLLQFLCGLSAPACVPRTNPDWQFASYNPSQHTARSVFSPEMQPFQTPTGYNFTSVTHQSAPEMYRRPFALDPMHSYQVPNVPNIPQVPVAPFHGPSTQYNSMNHFPMPHVHAFPHVPMTQLNQMNCYPMPPTHTVHQFPTAPHHTVPPQCYQNPVNFSNNLHS